MFDNTLIIAHVQSNREYHTLSNETETHVNNCTPNKFAIDEQVTHVSSLNFEQ